MMILVVEDDKDLSELLRVNMAEIGVEVEVANCGEQGLSLALSRDFDLIVLDLTLPKVNGFDICRQVRMQKPEQIIVMLTAKNSETDRVLGLELGADDYLTKPFSIRELQARVRSQLRRVEVLKALASHDAPQDNRVQHGDLSIDTTQHQVFRGNEEIILTSIEFSLLSYLAHHPNQVFSRSQLLNAVWGYQHSGYEHTVNSHINRLRSKIERDATNPAMVQTVWGVGYKFNPDGARSVLA